MKHIGYWWASSNDIEMVEIEGAVYALHGWNGEQYNDCWRCEGEFYMDASKERYILRPVYKWIDEDECEIVDYEVY